MLAGAGSILAVLAFLGGMAVGHSWDGTSNQQGQFGGPGGGFRGPRYPMASATVDKEEGRRRSSRPEKRSDQKKKPGEGRPKEEDMQRGKWRWDGNDDY